MSASVRSIEPRTSCTFAIASLRETDGLSAAAGAIPGRERSACQRGSEHHQRQQASDHGCSAR